MRLPTLPTWMWIALAALVIVGIEVATITACGPWDPWETHYGEVARQILVRHDPLDLWWKPGYGPDGNAENTFWSKPALPFWLMALSMGALGVGSRPEVDEMVRSPWPEVAIRLPSLLAGLLCAVFLGYVVWRLLRDETAPRGRGPDQAARAGIFTAVVLATMPQWAIVTRQALTDMFLVMPVSVALGAWALAWLQPDRELRRRSLGELVRRPAGEGGGWSARVRRWTVPWDRAYTVFLVGVIVAAVVPLAALHMHVISDDTVARVARFSKKPNIPSVATLRQIHFHLLAYWPVVFGLLVVSLRWTRRSQVWMGVLYVAAGVSLVGKGMIGPGLVGMVVLADLVVRGRFDLLRRCGLVAGTLLFALASLPWHHAMALYRGKGWVNELIVINNLARFGSGEQDQAVGGFAYYVRTLGVAALPWSAAVPAALWAAIRWLRAPTPEQPDAPGASAATRGAAIRRFALLWAVATLALLTYSVTKYYHYLLPVLPPLALLVGLWLGELTEKTGDPGSRRTAWVTAGLGIGVLGLVLRDAVVEPAWIVHLTTYLYDHMWRQGAPPTERLVVMAVPFALALLLWAARRGRAAAGGMVFSALLTLGWIMNSYLPAASEHWSQRPLIRAYYDQRGPEDPIFSWWYYYRGETFFTKANIWMLKEVDKDKLFAAIDEHRGHGRTIWVITTIGHAKRLKTAVPADLRAGVEVVMESAHYSLLKFPVP